jgi:hypothetical protein
MEKWKSSELDINNSTKCLVWSFLGRVVNNDDDIDDDCLTIISSINKVEYLVQKCNQEDWGN